jgi:hypothetical protein
MVTVTFDVSLFAHVTCLLLSILHLPDPKRSRFRLIWIADRLIRIQADFAFAIKMELAKLLNRMKNEKCSAVFCAVRSLRGDVPVRCLAFLALAAFLTGCITNQVRDFTPKSAMVCDEVRITGKFHKTGDLDGVWFNGVPAIASFRHFPAPNGPLEILAVVPEGASNGPIRVKITTEEAALFGGKGADYTFRETFSVTGSPPVPAINSFSANPAIIKPGQTCTLQWEVSPTVKLLTLDGADVSGTTSKTVSPVTTTFYALVAKNESCLQRSQVLTVLVMSSPKITALGNPVYHPGDTLTVNGEGLAQTNESSQIILSQGATTITLPVATPSDDQLTVPIPDSLVGGPVNVQALVGSDASNTNTFVLEATKTNTVVPAVKKTKTVVLEAKKTNTVALVAKKNGLFVDIKSKIGFASQTCGSRQLQISTNVPGWTLPDLAVFQQDGAILAQHNFQPGIIGGAAFSPGGDQAVSVTADPNGFSASYVNVIERFATHYRLQFPVNIMEGYKTATGRWHVLFSPDDTMVMISSVPVGGPAKIAIQVHDLVRQKNIGTLIQANCAACDLQGEVINGNTVRVKLDGAVVATFPIY